MQEIAHNNQYPFLAPFVGSWILLWLLVLGGMLASFTVKTREINTELNEKYFPTGKLISPILKRWPVKFFNIIGILLIITIIFLQIESYFDDYGRSSNLLLMLLLTPVNLIIQIITIKYLHHQITNKDIYIQRCFSIFKPQAAVFLGTNKAFIKLWYAFVLIANASIIIQGLLAK